MIEFDQAREDLRKTRFRATVYLLGGAGLFVIGVILIALYANRREIPSLMLGIVGFFWAAMLFYQMVKARKLERAMRVKIDGMEEAGEVERAGQAGEHEDAEAPGAAPETALRPPTGGDEAEEGARGGGSRES